MNDLDELANEMPLIIIRISTMRELKFEPMPTRRLNGDKVVYYVRDTNTNNLITKFDTDTLKAKDIEGWENFTPTQQLELQNYLSNVRFTIDKLRLPAKLNRDYRFSLPEPLQSALVDIFNKAENNNIYFDPMAAMLNGLFTHLTTTEKRLQACGEPPVLSQFNIHTAQIDKSESDKELRKHAKKIFKHFKAIKNSLDLYSKFAHDYFEKETNLNYTAVENYIEGKAKPSKWSISCALMVLGQHEDVSSLLPISLLIPLWLTPLRFTGKLTATDKAIGLFKDIFKLENKASEEAVKFIEMEMQQSI